MSQTYTQSEQYVQSTQIIQPIQMCYLCNSVKSSINHIWNVWNQKSLKIKNTCITLLGFSVAALRTNFFLKELNIMFDGGLSSNYVPDHVFITHLHTDHIASCPWHFDPGDTKRNVKFYVPLNTGLLLKNFLEASHPYKGHNSLINQQSTLNGAFSIIEVEDGKNLEIEIKGSKYILEIIRCYHTVMCTSYGLSEIKKKLKQEYSGLKGAEIKKLKDEGIEITDTLIKPFFLYVGDTFKRNIIRQQVKKIFNNYDRMYFFRGK